jgi:uncharacterized membrane protein YedE/YeeE
MSRRVSLTVAVIGVVFGFLLTASGLGNYRTIHRGLLLKDAYIYLMMASTVATAAVGVQLLKRRGRTVLGEPLRLPHHPVRRSTLYGATVFGLGFGVGATCPGITVAMIATGGFYGAVVLGGIFAGLWLRGRVEERELSNAHSALYSERTGLAMSERTSGS